MFLNVHIFHKIHRLKKVPLIINGLQMFYEKYEKYEALKAKIFLVK